MRIEEKLNKLTTIPTTNFLNLFNLLSEVCCDDILNTISDGSDSACVDIGIGKLMFLLDDEGIVYKFIPSEKFEDMIVKSIKTNKSPLIAHLERGISEKIVEAYKNLM